MDWSGVDHLWIIVMFLSAVWTLILTAPIHCRASIAETVMQCYISPNLMKKQTHPHLGRPEGEHILIFWWTINIWIEMSSVQTYSTVPQVCHIQNIINHQHTCGRRAILPRGFPANTHTHTHTHSVFTSLHFTSNPPEPFKAQLTGWRLSSGNPHQSDGRSPVDTSSPASPSSPHHLQIMMHYGNSLLL